MQGQVKAGTSVEILQAKLQQTQGLVQSQVKHTEELVNDNIKLLALLQQQEQFQNIQVIEMKSIQTLCSSVQVLLIKYFVEILPTFKIGNTSQL